MSALEHYRGQNALPDQGIEELSTVVGYMSAFGVPADHFMVDLTIARGLDYYTGTVYETVMLDHPRSAPSVPAADMTTYRNITLINNSWSRNFHWSHLSVFCPGGPGLSQRRTSSPRRRMSSFSP